MLLQAIMEPSFKATKVTQQQERLPIKVTCVLGDLDDRSDAIQDIRTFCVGKGLMVETRKYNSHVYKNDRDEIIRLPAFHIEVEGKWERTIYVVGRPYQIIGETINHYLERRKQRLARKGKFKKYMDTFVTWIRQKLHKKTAMERYQEQTIDDWDNSRTRTFSYLDTL